MYTGNCYRLTGRVSSIVFVGLLVIACGRTDAPTATDNLAASSEDWLKYDVDDQHVTHDRSFGSRGFHFVSMSDAGVDAQGVNHRILMTGTGRFNNRRAVGGGFFNHFDLGSAVPQTLLAAGTWRAGRVISFTRTDHPENPWGFNLSGLLEMEVRLFPVGGPRHGIPAVLTIVCNIPPAGILTGLPEGYFLTFDDLNFQPASFPGGFPFGITSFSVNPRDSD